MITLKIEEWTAGERVDLRRTASRPPAQVNCGTSDSGETKPRQFGKTHTVFHAIILACGLAGCALRSRESESSGIATAQFLSLRQCDA
jgi:hypothetical protein